jgi:hypothetical protein
MILFFGIWEPVQIFAGFWFWINPGLNYNCFCGAALKRGAPDD